MAGENLDESEDLDDLETDDNEDTIVINTDDDDDVDIDMSAEINVDELVAKIEKQNLSEIERKKQVRRRLEQLHEERMAARDLDSTYNFNLDDDF